MKELNSWILSRQRGVVHDTEELSILDLVGKTAHKTNEVIQEMDKKVTQGGDFTGSWHGIDKPSKADETISSVVEQNVEDIGVLKKGKVDIYIGSTLPNIIQRDIKTIYFKVTDTDIVEPNYNLKVVE